MKSIVISHFYNEEYLLPFWLKHHKNIFDHGIMINYGSTDKSCEIVREICPNWKLVDSENNVFDAVLCDFEVMKYEQNFKGFIKIALNTTEFLCGDHEGLKKLLQKEKYRNSGIYIPTKVVLPNYKGETVNSNQSLTEQFTKGVFHDDMSLDSKEKLKLGIVSRNRIIHNCEIGAYSTGRHSSFLSRLFKLSRNNGHAYIAWFGFAPFSEETIKRRLQIKNRIPLSDKTIGRGRQHQINKDELEDILHVAASIV